MPRIAIEVLTLIADKVIKPCHEPPQRAQIKPLWERTDAKVFGGDHGRDLRQPARRDQPSHEVLVVNPRHCQLVIRRLRVRPIHGKGVQPPVACLVLTLNADTRSGRLGLLWICHLHQVYAHEKGRSDVPERPIASSWINSITRREGPRSRRRPGCSPDRPWDPSAWFFWTNHHRRPPRPLGHSVRRPRPLASRGRPRSSCPRP